MAAPGGDRLVTYLLAVVGGLAAVLRLPGEPDRLFVLKLADNPGAQAEFGPWQRVDHIDDRPQQAARKGGEGDDYEIRYRVERAA